MLDIILKAMDYQFLNKVKPVYKLTFKNRA